MKPIYFLLFVFLIACKNETNIPVEKETQTSTFSIEHIDARQGYSEAVIVEANGTKTIYISGQVGEGEDFEAQFRDAINKLTGTLENTGATFKDVVKYSTFVVDYKPEYLDAFRAVRKEVLGDANMPASTLVGVETLGAHSWGVEIEAIAVIEAD
ncbi:MULTISPECIES: RidA family protein [unclassified Croceitalea]|uniref:RidA family protein n=1 Tax=unclassified Croceitalea TaxID=2632280 RepID=UPI0030DB9D2F